MEAVLYELVGNKISINIKFHRSLASNLTHCFFKKIIKCNLTVFIRSDSDIIRGNPFSYLPSGLY